MILLNYYFMNKFFSEMYLINEKNLMSITKTYRTFFYLITLISAMICEMIESRSIDNFNKLSKRNISLHQKKIIVYFTVVVQRFVLLYLYLFINYEYESIRITSSQYNPYLKSNQCSVTSHWTIYKFSFSEAFHCVKLLYDAVINKPFLTLVTVLFIFKKYKVQIEL